MKVIKSILNKLKIRKINYILKCLLIPISSEENKIERKKIDVLIPILPKDLRILPFCLKGIKKNVNHRISEIYIISPKSEKILNFCGKNNLKFIDESTLFNYGVKDINFITTGGINRSGWVFQQLIKLHGSIGKEEDYLVIDSDHILIRKHSFITEKDIPIFYQSSENHKPYYKNLKKLFPKMKLSKLSFVCHKMIFNKKNLEELKKELENQFNKRWDQVILENLSKEESSPFSEFETYGNWVTSKKSAILLPWREKSFRYEKLESYEKLLSKYSKKYKSITFPEYYNRGS